MKILFAIQGTGNGHLSRARDIYPELAKYGDVDVLISGIQADVAFPFAVKYKFHGMSFIFGSKGGVDIWKTTKSVKLFRLVKDIKNLPVEDYDLVINDFEPVASWACKMKHVPCIALSHQSAVIDKNAPKPKEKDWFGELVLNHYAPHTAAYGFHFAAYSPNIHTPIIRRQIREIVPTDEGHYTVYLPAYDDETIVGHLSRFDSVQWQVFSKHNKEAFTFKNISVQPIDNDAFIQSMASCTGVLCGAGFEGPAEALYLGKKVMAIPMVGQYEQHCNAAGLESLGVPIIRQLNKKYYDDIHRWLVSTERVKVNFPDNAAKVVEQLIHEQAGARELQPAFAK